MKRGAIHTRADVNYSASSRRVSELYAAPQYPLVRINDIVTRLQYGTSALASAEPIGLPILRMNNLQDDGWDLSDLKYIDLSETEAELYRLVPGDLLFNRTNSKELVGKCAVFREPEHYVFASYLIRVSMNTEIALPDYVSDFLSTRAGRTQIDRVSRQIVGMSNINAEEIRQLQVPLPPLDIQRQLVAEMQAARERRAQQLADADRELAGIDAFLLDALGLTLPSTDTRKVFAVRLKNIQNRLDVHANQPRFRVLFASMKPPMGKLGLSVHSLQELSSEILSGTTPLSGGDAYTDSSTGIPFVRSGDITKAGSIRDAEIFLKRDIHETSMRRSQLKYGDVLIAIVGATIGAVGVYDRHNAANMNQAIAAVRLKDHSVSPDYVSWFIKSSVGQAQLEYLKRPVARANINLDEVGQILIPVPPLQIQQDILKEISKCKEAAQGLREAAARDWEAAKAAFERKLLGA